MGRKNTREKKRKQKKDMYCPCLDGEQGMQGVVMTLTAENIKKALKEIFGGNVVDDEAGNEVEEFFIDTEEEKCADGNEAVCDQTEKPDRRYVTDYKNQGYYSLSKKDQRMVDMYVRNYIDMNDQMVDEYVLMDSSRLGKDLILALGCVVDDPLSVSEKLFDYLEDLYMQDKLRQVRAAIHALGIILLSEDSYLEDMECCKGIVKASFLAGVFVGMKSEMEKLRGNVEQE